MSSSQRLKPEYRATPWEVKQATRGWSMYKANVILKRHPELNRDDLIVYLELQPWDSFSIEGFETVESVRANETAIAG